jgi:hypothetical protein
MLSTCIDIECLLRLYQLFCIRYRTERQWLQQRIKWMICFYNKFRDERCISMWSMWPAHSALNIHLWLYVSSLNHTCMCPLINYIILLIVNVVWYLLFVANHHTLWHTFVIVAKTYLLSMCALIHYYYLCCFCIIYIATRQWLV